jgi:hypothetical protein
VAARVGVAEPSRRRSRARRLGRGLTVLLGVAVVAITVFAVAKANGHHEATGLGTSPPTPVVSTAPACTPLPYEPCGQPPAPFTDGRTCLPGHADYNGIAADGCEAASDYVAGTALEAHRTIRANLVPADAVDSFRTYVRGSMLNFCTGVFKVTLTAPAGVADRVDLVDGDRVVATAVSRDGEAATARAGEPACFRDNSTWLTVRVSSVEGVTASDFSLTRSGGW